MKWTQHKLTEPMLKRLAKAQAGRATGAGNTCAALERRGMLEDSGRPWPHSYSLTELGSKTLAEARREGW